MAKMCLEDRLIKAKSALMRSKEFCLYSGVIMIGSSKVDENCPTAYTNGRDVVYGRAFGDKLTDPELAFVVMHETLHKALHQLTMYQKLWKEDGMLANVAADYVVNQMIMDAGEGSNLVSMVEGGLIDPKYRGWSTKEVFDDLKKQGKSGKDYGGGEGSPFDEHGWGEAETLSREEREELTKQIDNALRQGGMLAGKMGAKVPRDIEDLLTPKVNWREVMQEFVSAIAAGKDSASWRQYDRRWVSNGCYLPVSIAETVGKGVIAIDTSGSIGGREITEFATEVASLCQSVMPEGISVLWWDTNVHGVQEFEQGDYDNIGKLLKPVGGGGTMVSCVNEFIGKENMRPEFVLVLTDGYVEDEIDWSNITCPTLWLVTQRKDFNPPQGKVVEFDPEV